MSFVRPEASDWFMRWREALIGGAIALWGLNVFLTSFGIGRAAGGLAVALGLALVFTGVRRARRPAVGDGPGVVEVDERQITWFGPNAGGAVSVDALTKVEIRTTAADPFDSDFYWVFHHGEGPPLEVPGDAAGADALFDALSPLSDIDYGGVIRAAANTTAGRVVVWERDPH